MSTELQTLVEQTVSDLGYEFVGLEYARRPGNDLLRVYIDRPETAHDPGHSGITLDDCQNVSGNLSAMLDVEDPLPGAYTLEVSSPGLDRPLFTEAQFERFAGNKARLVLSVPVEGRSKFTGTLAGVDSGQVRMTLEDGNELMVPIGQVRSARLVPVLP